MFIKFMMPMFAAVDAGSGGGEATDLTDVINSSLEGLDRGGEEEGVTPPPVDKAAITPDPAKDAEEKELAALQAEIRAKNPQMRGKIDIDRHQAVLTRTRNMSAKEAEAWKAKEAKYQKDLADHQAKLKEWDQYKWAQDPDIQSALMAIELSERDQRKFAELLLSDPRFAEILTFKDAKAEVASDRPGPNQRTADGKMEYYDDQGIEKLLNWHGSQVSKSVEKQLEAKFTKMMEERFGKLDPMVEKFELQNAWHEALSTQKGVLQNARDNWPGFKEGEAACKKFMLENPKAQLDDAYREVVVKGMQRTEAEKEAAWRQRYQKEMEAKRLAGGGLKPAAGTGVEKVARDGNEKRDMADIIRESIAGLK